MEKDKITITKLLKNGVSVELLANSFTSLSKECIQELKDKLEMEAVV